jgi:quinol monooxygenase YgiN
VSPVAIVARVTVKEGRAGEYVAAFEPLLERAKEEPGTLLHALHRSKDDPHVSWTTEV